jgi:hypothetical protein
MKRLLWMLLFLNSSHSALAQEINDVDFLSTESILENELLTEESSIKDFGELVKSTLDLMGPKAETTPFSSTGTSAPLE